MRHTKKHLAIYRWRAKLRILAGVHITFGCNKTPNLKPKSKHYTWLREDSEFKSAIEALEPEEIFLDFVENALTQKISKGDTTAIIFALKTKGKKRGYQERTEITGADGEAIILNFVKRDGNG